MRSPLTPLVAMQHVQRKSASPPGLLEISRVARKEVRVEIETLKKASVAHRASIAELRRQVSALEKELRRIVKGGSAFQRDT